MEDSELYKIPGDTWKKNNVENLESILAEAHSFFNSDLALFRRSRNQMLAVVRILIPIVSLLVAFFSGVFFEDGTTVIVASGAWWTLAILTLVLCGCMLVAGWSIQSMKLQPEGVEPRVLVREHHLHDTDKWTLSKDERRVDYLMYRIETLQLSIDRNKPRIEATVRKFDIIVRVILSSLTLAAISLLLVALF